MNTQQTLDHPRIPTRPICHRCRRYITIDTEADDDLWLEVIGPLHGPGYICADCFTRAADERLIRWEGKLKLVPISLAAQADVQARVEAGDYTTPPPAPAAEQVYRGDVPAAAPAAPGAGVGVDEAIRTVREAELFEDGLSGDLHDAGITTVADAYMRGRLDACDELTAALAGKAQEESNGK